MNNWIITYNHYPVHGSLVGNPVIITSKGFDYNQFSTKLMIPFRLYDDDGVLYYSGFMTEYDFEPLHDYGMPDSGCTRLDYWDKDEKEWKTL